MKGKSLTPDREIKQFIYDNYGSIFPAGTNVEKFLNSKPTEIDRETYYLYKGKYRNNKKL